jgi:hypothetical protein
MVANSSDTRQRLCALQPATVSPHSSELRNVTVPLAAWLDVNCPVTCTSSALLASPIQSRIQDWKAGAHGQERRIRQWERTGRPLTGHSLQPAWRCGASAAARHGAANANEEQYA